MSNQFQFELASPEKRLVTPDAGETMDPENLLKQAARIVKERQFEYLETGSAKQTAHCVVYAALGKKCKRGGGYVGPTIGGQAAFLSFVQQNGGNKVGDYE